MEGNLQCLYGPGEDDSSWFSCFQVRVYSNCYKKPSGQAKHQPSYHSIYLVPSLTIYLSKYLSVYLANYLSIYLSRVELASKEDEHKLYLLLKDFCSLLQLVGRISVLFIGKYSLAFKLLWFIRFRENLFHILWI